MIKARPITFTNNITKQKNKQNQIKYFNRKYIKLNQNYTDLGNIIKRMQKSVKELKNYHQSLTKINNKKLKKSHSQNQLLCKNLQINKNKQNISNNLIRKNTINSNQSQLTKKQGVLCSISKYPFENISTMIGLPNSDIQEVKKAYQQTYGKQNTNIVDLYHFFRKNIQKSTRIQGSMQLSNLPNNEVSQEFHKSKSDNFNIKKKQKNLNVIIEDRNQKENYQFNKQQNKGEGDLQNVLKNSKYINPSIQEIFKNGCPDLANVYDFVKKRRVSLKNYVKFEKNKQNNQQKGQNINQNEEKISNSQQIMIKNNIFSEEKQNKKQEFNNSKRYDLQNTSQKKSIQKSEQRRLKNSFQADEKQFKTGYLRSINSNKSQKSSSKKQKLKQNIYLNMNIFEQDIKQNKIQVNSINYDENEQKRFQKFKKSKYYVDPIPFKLQKNGNSLDGCSISVKSSSRIIQLDFIPLDL